MTCNPVTYTFTGNFTPSSTLMQTCTAQVYTTSGSGAGSGSGSQAQTTFSGQGVSPPYQLQVDKTMLTFSVPDNTSSTQMVTVTNVGSMGLTVLESDSGMTSVYSYSPNVAVPLASGSAQTFSVMCSPTVAGSYGAVLDFETSAME